MSKLRFLPHSIFGILCLFMLNSCSNPGGVTYSDTPTSGTVSISVDESYSLLFDTQVYTFESLYPDADIRVRYKPEQEALQDLMDDSSKVAVLNRELSEEEKKQFSKKKIFPKTVKIASDAIALIVHPDNTDTLLTVKQLKRYLKGEDTVWKSQKGKPIQLVFDNNHSANYRYMRQLIDGENMQKNCFAVKSNPEVIEYVGKHPGALGIISVNWISDKDDTLSQRFLKKIKVVAMSDQEVPDELMRYRKPYLAYMVTGEYPLTRDVYMINRQTRAGLGMGFVSFVAGDKGQRMMKLAGLVPATFPVRLVEIKK